LGQAFFIGSYFVGVALMFNAVYLMSAIDAVDGSSSGT
jgi:hypothetical protein